MGLSDVAAFAADVALKADAYSATTHTSAAIDTAGYHQALVVFSAGTHGGTSTVTVEAATTSGGSYSAVTGAAFAQVSSSNDDAIFVGRVNLDSTDRYLKVKAVVATGACDLAVSVLLTPYYTGDGATFSFEV